MTDITQGLFITFGGLYIIIILGFSYYLKMNKKLYKRIVNLHKDLIDFRLKKK